MLYTCLFAFAFQYDVLSVYTGGLPLHNFFCPHARYRGGKKIGHVEILLITVNKLIIENMEVVFLWNRYVR